MKNNEIKRYFKHFLVPIIIVAVLLAIFLFASNSDINETAYDYESTNTERVYGDQRIFDYAELLTEEEEAELTAYIHENEKASCTDIVIVTLNESLKEFSESYSEAYGLSDTTPDEYIMRYADEFWESYKFGYNCPQVLDGGTDTGDGVLLADNIFREPETGKIYTWLCTTGASEERLSDYDIDYILDAFYEDADYDYCAACYAFIDSYISCYFQESLFSKVPYKLIIISVIIFLLFYIISHIKSKKGNVTTDKNSYLIPGTAGFTVNEDVLVNKHVTKRYNPPSSSSGGGGGHHSSGGGGSHGGGGHSR